jgi:hypothetical protein
MVRDKRGAHRYAGEDAELPAKADTKIRASAAQLDTTSWKAASICAPLDAAVLQVTKGDLAQALGIRDAESPPRSTSHSRTPSVRRDFYM